MSLTILPVYTDPLTYLRGEHITRCRPSVNDPAILVVYTLDGRVSEYSQAEARTVLAWLAAKATHSDQFTAQLEGMPCPVATYDPRTSTWHESPEER